MNEAKNCQWRVARRPEGNVVREDFEYKEIDIPDIQDGEVLLKTLYLNLAPVMRMYMSGESAAGEQSLDIGDVIHGRGVAEIIESKHSDYKEGEIVQGQMGWQTYKASKMTDKEKFRKIPDMGAPYTHFESIGNDWFICLFWIFQPWKPKQRGDCGDFRCCRWCRLNRCAICQDVGLLCYWYCRRRREM